MVFFFKTTKEGNQVVFFEHKGPKMSHAWGSQMVFWQIKCFCWCILALSSVHSGGWLVFFYKQGLLGTNGGSLSTKWVFFFGTCPGVCWYQTGGFSVQSGRYLVFTNSGYPPLLLHLHRPQMLMCPLLERLMERVRLQQAHISNFIQIWSSIALHKTAFK